LKPVHLCALSLATFTAVLCTPAVPQAQGAPRPALQRSSQETSFESPDASGHLEYTKEYSAGSARNVWIVIQLKKEAPLYCLEYRDFVFGLFDVAGSRVAATDLSARPVSAELGFHPPVPPKGGYPPSGCIVPPGLQKTTHDKLILSLDALYPDLKPGPYTLMIKLSPRDNAVPTVTFPKLTFTIDQR